MADVQVDRDEQAVRGMFSDCRARIANHPAAADPRGRGERADGHAGVAARWPEHCLPHPV